MQFTKRNKIIIAIIAVMLAGLLVWNFTLRPASITFSGLPSSSTVTINGKKVSPDDKVNLDSGQKTIVITKKGFMPKTIKQTVKNGQTVNVNTELLVDLNYLAKGGKYDLSKEDIQAQGGIYEPYASQGVTQAMMDNVREVIIPAKMPIIKKLPYIGDGFEVHYGQSPSSKYWWDLAIFIHSSNDKGKQDALNWLMQNGTDPNSVEIVYKDL